jgi:hypothetical protein
MISEGSKSTRDYVLLDTHPAENTDRWNGDAIIVGDWKILRATDSGFNQDQDGWYVAPGEDHITTPYSIRCNDKDQSTWKSGKSLPYGDCLTDWCLFNIAKDPCEYHNVAKEHPDILNALLTRLSSYQSTAVKEISVFDCDPVLVDAFPSSSNVEAGVEGYPKFLKAWRPCDMLDPYPSAAVLK